MDDWQTTEDVMRDPNGGRIEDRLRQEADTWRNAQSSVPALLRDAATVIECLSASCAAAAQAFQAAGYSVNPPAPVKPELHADQVWRAEGRLGVLLGWREVVTLSGDGVFYRMSETPGLYRGAVGEFRAWIARTGARVVEG